jgi:predicted type IV restriction endonuclease
MPKPSLDKTIKKNILNACHWVEENAKADGNEAETRKRIDRIFETVMGYDTFKHITQEYAISGAGDTVHCDIAIQLSHEDQSKPDVIIEVKRVGVNLSPKHIRQAASYAIDIGCEWILLTNSKEWRLYHITYMQPPQTKLIESWDLLNDDVLVLHKKFEIVSYNNVRKHGLDKLWEKRNVLTAGNILKAILAEDSIRLFQHKIKKATDVSVSPEDIVSSFRHLLNEAAISEMDKVKIALPAKKQRAKTSKASKTTAVEQEVEAILAEKDSQEDNP